jgi:hypothetical protein
LLVVGNAAGRFSHAVEVRGDDPDEKGYPSPPGWVLGVRTTTSPREIFYVEKPSKMSWLGLINRRRCGYKKNDLIFCKWNVRTLFKTAALVTLISQLRQYRLDICRFHPFIGHEDP